MKQAPLAEFRGISKRFGGVVALDKDVGLVQAELEVVQGIFEIGCRF